MRTLAGMSVSGGVERVDLCCRPRTSVCAVPHAATPRGPRAEVRAEVARARQISDYIEGQINAKIPSICVRLTVCPALPYVFDPTRRDPQNRQPPALRSGSPSAALADGVGDTLASAVVWSTRIPYPRGLVARHTAWLTASRTAPGAPRRSCVERTLTHMRHGDQHRCGSCTPASIYHALSCDEGSPVLVSAGSRVGSGGTPRTRCTAHAQAPASGDLQCLGFLREDEPSAQLAQRACGVEGAPGRGDRHGHRAHMGDGRDGAHRLRD